MTLRLRKWDAAEHFELEEDLAAYLDAGLESNNPDVIMAVMHDIARALGVANIVRRSKMSREDIHRALQPGGVAEFHLVLKLIYAMGLNLHVVPAQPDAP